MTNLDLVVDTIRRAVALVGKSATARCAGLGRGGDTRLRGVETDQWNPELKTLRLLEPAAAQILEGKKREAA